MPTKHPGGRPTTYRPQYGAQIAKAMAGGLSAEAAAARLAKAGSAAVPVVTDWSAAATADLVIEAIGGANSRAEWHGCLRPLRCRQPFADRGAR